MLDIKKQRNSATITTLVIGVDNLEGTINNMVRYAKELKTLKLVNYNDFEFDDVFDWLYNDDIELTPNVLERFAEFVQSAGEDDYDGYYVTEYLYMFEETRTRVLDEE